MAWARNGISSIRQKWAQSCHHARAMDVPKGRLRGYEPNLQERWRKSHLQCGACSDTWSLKCNQLLKEKEGNPSPWKHVWGVVPMVVLQRQKALRAGWGNPMPLATHPCISGCPLSLGSHRQLDMKLHYISFRVFQESLTFLPRGICATSGKCVLTRYIPVGPC